QVSTNRFALLSDNADDVNSQISEGAAKATNAKPPPIFIREENSSSLVKKITQLIGSNKFHIIPLSKGNIRETKVQIYVKVLEALKEQGFNPKPAVNIFNRNTIPQLLFKVELEPENKPLGKNDVSLVKKITQLIGSNKFHIIPLSKGNFRETKVQIYVKVLEALKEQGFNPKAAVNIFNRNKIPQPMFKVELEPENKPLGKNDVHPIYKLQYLLHRRITVEEPHKRNGPVQCTNCQEYGHTRSYCTLRSVCVACGELHVSATCTSNKEDPRAKNCDLDPNLDTPTDIENSIAALESTLRAAASVSTPQKGYVQDKKYNLTNRKI
ncbi:PREDICTED: nucleic-acid-binding protein from mobile element jockey-like, partial [Rhagoletis zephyria]|uniref:nucleic-acid-binding protein from mobile element jockey-like n=1 Tax=Rhagoletis zephyria TaxID=28612 RepID=UPI0008116E62